MSKGSSEKLAKMRILIIEHQEEVRDYASKYASEIQLARFSFTAKLLEISLFGWQPILKIIRKLSKSPKEATSEELVQAYKRHVMESLKSLGELEGALEDIRKMPYTSYRYETLTQVEHCSQLLIDEAFMCLCR